MRSRNFRHSRRSSGRTPEQSPWQTNHEANTRPLTGPESGVAGRLFPAGVRAGFTVVQHPRLGGCCGQSHGHGGPSSGCPGVRDEAEEQDADSISQVVDQAHQMGMAQVQQPQEARSA